MKKRYIIVVAIAFALIVGIGSVVYSQVGNDSRQGGNHVSNVVPTAVGTAFTYQGRLKDTGNIANGNYEFAFTLYDAPVGGSQIGSTITRTAAITDGLFTVSLDFGDVFTGTERFLAVGVRAFGSVTPPTILTPRQKLTTVPYAAYANHVPWNGITDMPLELTEDRLKYFEEELSIPTNGALDWESFTIGNDYYLVVANYFNDSTHNIDSHIYKWNGTSFALDQSIPTNNANDWEFFTIGGDSYLAVANPYNGSTFNIDSHIYKWNGASFVLAQSIPTNGANDWEFFTIGSDSYLVVANNFNSSTWNIDSHIYRWNGASFVLAQSIPTNGAIDWEFFTIGNDAYLVVANGYNGSTYNLDSHIYKWNGASFVLAQSIATNGAFDWKSFTINDETYLTVANHYNDSAYDIDSHIYKWNGASFILAQSIPTVGATDWEFFTIGSDAYLAVANNNYNGTTFNIDSHIYQWNGTSFILIQSVSTIGAYDWEFFTIGSDAYLAMANDYNGSTHNIDSRIYKAVLESGGSTFSLWQQNGSDLYYNDGNVGVGTTNPASTLDVNGYIQLDTVTAAPPATDCDEASERGRMKVDTVNGLLYICVDAGWVSK